MKHSTLDYHLSGQGFKVRD